jgi:hypothetical protein
MAHRVSVIQLSSSMYNPARKGEKSASSSALRAASATGGALAKSRNALGSDCFKYAISPGSSMGLSSAGSLSLALWLKAPCENRLAQPHDVFALEHEEPPPHPTLQHTPRGFKRILG